MNANKEVVVITGCSGRIGTQVMAKLKDPKYQLVGLDVIEPLHSPDNFFFINTDISSEESIEQAFNQIRTRFGSTIASVIHLAAYYNFAGGEWAKYEQITVKGTERLLAAASKSQTQQFLFSSTMLVHAPCEVGQRMNENSPLCGSWEYPRSKIETESILMKKHGSIPLVILRIAGCYDNECHSIPISNQIQRIYEKQLTRALFPGDITHGASFLHLDDMAEVCFLCIEKRKELPKEFVALVGEEETLSYDYLQRAISTLLFGKELKTYQIPKWFAKFGAWMQNCIPGMDSFIKPWMIDLADQHYALDLTKIKNTLKWQPNHALRATLPVMIQKLKNDPQGWYKVNGLKFPKRGIKSR